MLKPLAFANAFAVVSLILYVVCRFLSLIIPDFLFAVGQSWFHTFNLGSSKTITPLEVGTFLFGGITLAALAWVSAYLLVLLYNKWYK